MTYSTDSKRVKVGKNGGRKRLANSAKIEEVTMKVNLTKFKLLFLPLVVLLAALLLSVLIVATELDLRLQAYGVPFLPVKFNSKEVKGVAADSIKQESTLAAFYQKGVTQRASSLRKTFAVTRSSLPTLTPSVTLVPTETPNPTQQAALAACRRDCTSEKCPEDLVCMAIASDEGIYSYQCMSPDCSPFHQNEDCQCVKHNTLEVLIP